MTASDDYIMMIKRLLPDKCTSRDLIKVGLFNSPPHLRGCILRGEGPSYFFIGKRYFFTRDAVIEWLKECKHEHHTPNGPKKEKKDDSNRAQGMAQCCRA